MAPSQQSRRDHQRQQLQFQDPPSSHNGRGRHGGGGAFRGPTSTAATTTEGGNRRSRSRDRRSHHTQVRRVKAGCCSDPEVRKGAGAVLFALGILAAVAGVVMTVVAATDDTQNGKYPPAFSAVGPVLLVSAFILVLAGFSLISPIMANLAERCFSFDDPDSLCRVYCPRLSHFIKPDDTISRNRAAMDALKTEPVKSVLKRQPPPQPVTQNGAPTKSSPDTFDTLPTMTDSAPVDENIPTTTSSGRLPSQGSLDAGMSKSAAALEPNQRRAGFKGVRFSESDLEEGFKRRGRTTSVTSDSSILSLRNCKIHPKDDPAVWFTDEHTKEVWKGGSTERSTTEL